jgi:hypothetical protein
MAARRAFFGNWENAYSFNWSRPLVYHTPPGLPPCDPTPCLPCGKTVQPRFNCDTLTTLLRPPDSPKAQTSRNLHLRPPERWLSQPSFSSPLIASRVLREPFKCSLLFFENVETEGRRRRRHGAWGPGQLTRGAIPYSVRCSTRITHVGRRSPGNVLTVHLQERNGRPAFQRVTYSPMNEQLSQLAT